jgi:hypothetical protein
MKDKIYQNAVRNLKSAEDTKRKIMDEQQGALIVFVKQCNRLKKGGRLSPIVEIVEKYIGACLMEEASLKIMEAEDE